MNKYKCDHTPGNPRTGDQRLDMICRGCIKAWIARVNLLETKYEKLLEFVKNRAYLHYSDDEMHQLKLKRYSVYHQITGSRELLKEIGEDE